MWGGIEHAAMDKGVLDRVDAALIRSLARRIERSDDLAFHAVVGCLLSTVRSGGLRIPLEPGPLALRLEEFLRPLLEALVSPGGKPDDAESTSPAPESGAEDIRIVEAAENPTAMAVRLAREFDAGRAAGSYAAVIGSPPEFLPLLQSGGGLYFQKHQAAEASAGFRLAGLLSARDSGLDPAGTRNLLDTVLDRVPLRLSPAPDAPAMVFDPRQREALALALRKRFTVISGGPGTGKTSLAANLLRAWTRAWLDMRGRSADAVSRPASEMPRIRLAAPTGRAAQRLAESLRRSLETVRPEGRGDAGSGPDRFVADLPCETLHALLRYNPGTGDYFHQAHRPIPADLIVIDEVSMVDIFALSRLLEALEKDACLVLLGDMDQLPSVEAGSVLADLVPGAGVSDHPLRDNLVILERSHRSEAGILDVTRRINAMDGIGALAAMPPPLTLSPPAWPVTFAEEGRKITPGGGCRMLAPARGHGQPADYRAGWAAWLDSWIDFHYLDHSFHPGNHPGRLLAAPRSASYETLVAGLCAFRPPEDGLFHAALAGKPASGGPSPAVSGDPVFLEWFARLGELFGYLDQARILTFTRKGWHGSVSVNRRIRERLVRRWDPRAPIIGTEGFNGSPILILENDHSKGLFNGDVGVLLRLAGRTLAFFRRADSFLAFPAAFLPRHETAFAMTVHKSQGSEYDQALLVLPESGNRLLYKETLYTALTRARYFAAIYGPEEVFLEAVGRKVVRESGLQSYLGAMARPE
jgi:exodeoxyribonuclease V alpha subunit